MNEDVYHSGILGMKWGVHKAARLADRKKALAVSKNEGAQASDRKRAKYESQSTGAKIVKSAASFLASQIISELLTGQVSSYSSMSKADIVKKVTQVATRTATNVALDVGIKNAAAKSAMKNYTNKGKALSSKRANQVITKEDLLDTGIRTGIKAAYVAALLGSYKMSKAKAKRQNNEERVTRWGQNILPKFVDNVVWSNGGTAVIDNRRR